MTIYDVLQTSLVLARKGVEDFRMKLDMTCEETTT